MGDLFCLLAPLAAFFIIGSQHQEGLGYLSIYPTGYQKRVPNQVPLGFLVYSLRLETKLPLYELHWSLGA